jgi:hypothetical protein
MLGRDVRDRRRHGRTVRDEPLRGRPRFFTIASWIAQRRRIGMQDAVASIEVTTRDPEQILVLSPLMMHANLLSPQHHQSELAGCIVHRVFPTHVSPVAMSARRMKVELMQLCRWPLRNAGLSDCLLSLPRSLAAEMRMNEFERSHQSGVNHERTG